MKKSILVMVALIIALTTACKGPISTTPPVYFTISFDGNTNESGEVPGSITKESGTVFVIPGNTGALEKAGYYFAGWNTRTDGTGTDYAEGDEVSLPSENLTLFAQWKIDAFTLLWTTDDKNAVLPFEGTGTIQVDWGDGSDIESFINPDTSSFPTHNYDEDGTYTIRITGDVSLWRIGYTYDSDKSERKELIDILHWGSFDFSSPEAFKYFTSLTTVTADDVPDLKEGSTFYNAFYDCISLQEIANISSWDTSKIKFMSYMFYGAKKFNQDISSWDVSSVTSTLQMFEFAESFNQDLSSWDVSSVTDMSRMFRCSFLFNQDLSDWNVSNVTDMSRMFGGAQAFNQDLSDWDVSKVTDMISMFEGATAFNQDLSDWASRVTSLDASKMVDMFTRSGLEGNEPGWYLE